MARTDLTVQDPIAAGLAPTYTAFGIGATNGFKTDPGFTLHVKNATGGTATLTIITPAAPDGNVIADKTVTIATATDRFFSFNQAVYKNDDGKVYIDCDVAATAALIS